MIGRYTALMQKLPRPLAVAVKWAMVYPRFWAQRAAARRGFREYGDRYPHPLLFVAGMPKSGTTWLERMLSSYPGYQEVLIPEATFAELRGEAGHLFELPTGAFARLRGCLVLTKMHCPGSPGNAAVLRAAGVPCVILHRDPRDVAVSYVHYVKGTPWHQDFPALRDLAPEECLRHFIRVRLPEFARWMRSWRDHRDPDKSLMLSYEELLADPAAALRRILDLFGLEAGAELVRELVERNRFEASHASGEGGGFFRKGIAGDWKNHFDESLKREFRDVDGKLLVEFGYETGMEW
jgi:hypothetical protein